METVLQVTAPATIHCSTGYRVSKSMRARNNRSEKDVVPRLTAICAPRLLSIIHRHSSHRTLSPMPVPYVQVTVTVQPHGHKVSSSTEAPSKQRMHYRKSSSDHTRSRPVVTTASRSLQRAWAAYPPGAGINPVPIQTDT
jgi:hypothetical protein